MEVNFIGKTGRKWRGLASGKVWWRYSPFGWPPRRGGRPWKTLRTLSPRHQSVAHCVRQSHLENRVLAQSRSLCPLTGGPRRAEHSLSAPAAPQPAARARDPGVVCAELGLGSSRSQPRGPSLPFAANVLLQTPSTGHGAGGPVLSTQLCDLGRPLLSHVWNKAGSLGWMSAKLASWVP